MTKVLVVDDHPMIRDAMRLYIDSASDLTWISDAADGLEAVNSAQRLRPDVVLMDLQLPELDGIGATEQIVASCPQTRVLACTTFSSEAQVIRALRAGASGYILKDADRQDLLEAIRLVAQGTMPLSSQVAKLLVLDVKNEPEAIQHTLERLDEAPTLSQRETEVLQLLSQGMSNKEMASAMFVEERTIKAHISSLNRKLKVRDRVQLLLRALELELVDGPR